MNNTEKTIKITKYIWEHDEYRYALGQVGKETLVFIGLNPSIGIPKHPDNTYQKLESLCVKREIEVQILNKDKTILRKEKRQFDSLILINLYPKVLNDRYYGTKNDITILTDKCLDEFNEKNFQIIKAIFADLDNNKIQYDVLCGWGNEIMTRKNSALNVINRLKEIVKTIPRNKFFCFEITKENHPKSPMARNIKNKLLTFELDNYEINTFSKNR